MVNKSPVFKPTIGWPEVLHCSLRTLFPQGRQGSLRITGSGFIWIWNCEEPSICTQVCMYALYMSQERRQLFLGRNPSTVWHGQKNTLINGGESRLSPVQKAIESYCQPTALVKCRATTWEASSPRRTASRARTSLSWYQVSVRRSQLN